MVVVLDPGRDPGPGRRSGRVVLDAPRLDSSRVGDQNCQVCASALGCGPGLMLLGAAEGQAGGADVFPAVAGVNGLAPLAGQRG